ncbi:MAG: sigma-54-dependent Fis family transcriptional regulator [Bdellovibrionota bacterium]
MGLKAVSTNLNESEILRELSLACEGLFRHVHSAELVDRIVGPCIRLTRSDRGTLFLATRDGHTYNEKYLTSKYASGVQEGVIQISSTAGIAGSVFTNDQPLVINDADADPRLNRRVSNDTGYRPQSLLSVPIRSTRGKNFGVLQMLNSQRNAYTDFDLHVTQLIATFAAMAFEQSDTLSSLDETEEKLRHSHAIYHKRINSFTPGSKNQALSEIYEKLPIFAKSDSSILIEGESGSGKEVVAQMLHQFSDRAKKEFVALNCAAIPESLFEAELFGVAKGAATGTASRKGKIEQADGGTLFLDEIGEMPLAMQAKLLRALQERSVTRVGFDGPAQKVDFRVLSATNRDLAELVREGKFREDLFYRLHVVRFRIPPLRQRLEDIRELSDGILRELAETRNLRRKTLSAAAEARLKAYDWPGNIRQLQNKLENALITSGPRTSLEPTDFSFEETNSGVRSDADPLAQLGVISLDLKDARASLDREVIRRALAQCKGNKTEAAKLLGLSREGLRLALRKVK